jgi:hypothetical protein
MLLPPGESLVQGEVDRKIGGTCWSMSSGRLFRRRKRMTPLAECDGCVHRRRGIEDPRICNDPEEAGEHAIREGGRLV